MSDYFLLDPDYKDFPEKGKLKFLTVYGEQHTFIILAVLGLIISILMALVMFFAFSEEWPYFTGSKSTEAVIIASCQPTHESFTYAFEVTDTQGNIQQYLGEAPQYKNNPCPKVQDQIIIEYLPDKPASSARYMPEGTSSLLNICAFSIGLLFFIAFIQLSIKDIFAFLRTCANYPKLKQATTILKAKIVAVKDSKKDKIHGRIRGDYCIEVEYEFIVNKQLFTGKQLHKRNDLRGKPLPSPGTRVRVLYADEITYVML